MGYKSETPTLPNMAKEELLYTYFKNFYIHLLVTLYPVPRLDNTPTDVCYLPESSTPQSPVTICAGRPPASRCWPS